MAKANLSLLTLWPESIISLDEMTNSDLVQKATLKLNVSHESKTLLHGAGPEPEGAKLFPGLYKSVWSGNVGKVYTAVEVKLKKCRCFTVNKFAFKSAFVCFGCTLGTKCLQTTGVEVSFSQATLREFSCFSNHNLVRCRQLLRCFWNVFTVDSLYYCVLVLNLCNTKTTMMHVVHNPVTVSSSRRSGNKMWGNHRKEEEIMRFKRRRK